MFGNRLSDLNTLKRKFQVAKCLNSSFHLTAYTLLAIRTIPLIVCVEMIVVYSERYVEYINTLCCWMRIILSIQGVVLILTTMI